MARRIAIFTNSIYTMGGEQRVVSIMANEFVKKHEVTIFTMDSHGKKNNLFQLSPEVKIKHYFPYKGDAVSFVFRAMTHAFPKLVYDIFPNVFERAYCSPKYARKMHALIGKNFDVVIVTAWQLTITLGQICKEFSHSFRAIGWEHSSYEAYFNEKYVHLYHHEAVFKENAKYLDHVIVLNQDYAEKYKKYLNIDCGVIYNPKSFFNEKKSKLVNKYFVTCGRFIYCKGYDLLIEAFHIFAQSDQEWKLLIAGDGSLRNNLERRVKELELDQRIIFLGQIKDIDKLLSEASIYLLTSRFEGFPMSVVEACETGLPVLSFDIPAMLPFKESGAAETVDCYDVQQYAEAMLDMAHSYENRCNLGKKAVIFAEQLTPENISECWNDYIGR